MRQVRVFLYYLVDTGMRDVLGIASFPLWHSRPALGKVGISTGLYVRPDKNAGTINSEQ